MKKKRFNWAAVLVFAGSLAVGAALGLELGKKLTLEDLSVPQMLLGLVLDLGLLVLSLWLNAAIHEAGHLVFGLLTGYGFSSYRLGSLMIVREDGALRLRRLKVAGTGGQCLMTPPEMVDGKMPFLLYNLGGSIANLLVSAVAWTAYLLLPQVRMLSFWLLGMAVMGLVLALSNGIPMRMGLVQNDGKNALIFCREPSALRTFYVQLRMTEALSRGVRVKDMPEEWFWMPTVEERKNPIGASAGVMYCNRLMDAHRFDEARAAMESMLDPDTDILDLHRRALTCDVIYCELIGQRRWDVIEALLSKEQKAFMKAMATNITVLRTQHLLALYHENDGVKARAFQAQFERQAAVYPYPCEVESEKELIAIAGERRAITSAGSGTGIEE